MKKKFRKFVTVISAVIMCQAICVTAFASDRVLSPYEQVLYDANKAYDLELLYIPVDESQVSVEEYKEITLRFAAEQRELLDYISSKEENEENVHSTRVTVVKTRTKPTWDLGQYFTIKATFTVYNGTQISACSNASLNRTSTAIVQNVYLTNVSSPTYSVIDLGTTSTVRYTATVHYNNSIGYGNTVLYTEFYCDD